MLLEQTEMSLFPQPTIQLFEGDCLDVMKGMPDNSIDFICCDPPYALTGKSGKGGFMGKAWDSEIPGVDIWKEALRICKPGAHLAAFGGSRTHHHLMLALEQAGWEIRDVIMWLYGQGFNKGLNIGKHVLEFEGYNSSLKPSYEPIILCMKPLDGTFAQNAETWGVAGLNIAASRIPSELPEGRLRHGGGIKEFFKGIDPECKHELPSGRYPSNVILDEFAAHQLDQQSGVSKSNIGKKNINNTDSIYMDGLKSQFHETGYSDSGGASRFFYTAKASPSERNRGLEGMTLKEQTCYGEIKGTPDHSANRRSKVFNFHPTVKPLALMRYIIKLLAPPGNPTCLDCFAGSGTTLLACKELGINCIGIEKEPEYCEIIHKRVGIGE